MYNYQSRSTRTQVWNGPNTYCHCLHARNCLVQLSVILASLRHLYECQTSRPKIPPNVTLLYNAFFPIWINVTFVYRWCFVARALDIQPCERVLHSHKFWYHVMHAPDQYQIVYAKRYQSKHWQGRLQKAKIMHYSSTGMKFWLHTCNT